MEGQVAGRTQQVAGNRREGRRTRCAWNTLRPALPGSRAKPGGGDRWGREGGRRQGQGRDRDKGKREHLLERRQVVLLTKGMTEEDRPLQVRKLAATVSGP